MHMVFSTSVKWYGSRQPVVGLCHLVHRTDIRTSEGVCRCSPHAILCESHFHTIQRDHLFPTVAIRALLVLGNVNEYVDTSLSSRKCLTGVPNVVQKHTK